MGFEVFPKMEEINQIASDYIRWNNIEFVHAEYKYPPHVYLNHIYQSWCMHVHYELRLSEGSILSPIPLKNEYR